MAACYSCNIMTYFLRVVTIVTVWCLFPEITIKAGQAPKTFDLASFYTTISRNNLSELNAVLQELDESSLPGKDAYQGALLMKKAGLLSKAKEKLSTFKSGRQKLEAAIDKEPGNAEYRFLRLIIQEHAPKIVKYKSNINDDSTMIIASFKKLSPVVQQAVKDYSKKSKTLAPSDF
jgi:hypothetical protein